MPDATPDVAAAAPEAVSARPLFLRACAGEPLERTPVWIMRQAGRYLPEYRAIREQHDFLTCCHTPELACEITLQPVRRLGVDAAILFSDILVPLPGMGVDVTFSPGPHLARAVRTPADVHALRVPDPRESTPQVLEAIRLLRRELPPGVPLIGFAGAPFTMATYLVEGGGSKSFSAVKQLLFAQPQVAHELLGTCADTVAAYLSAQVEAGAQAAMIFDTWAGLLGPDDVAVFVVPYVQRIVRRVRAAAVSAGDPGLPVIYYAGDSAGWLPLCRELGVDVVGIDWRQRLDTARTALGPDVTLQGNLDPALLLGSPELIRTRAAAVVAAAGGSAATRPARRHIFNLGHGILPQTPPAHAELLVATVRELTEVS